MITISIKQPFASLIVEDIKDIENRTWKLPEKYKGQRVLVHASAGSGNKFKINLTDEQTIAAFGSISKNAIEGTFPFGAIIGSVEILDCVINHESIWAEKTEGVLVGHAFYTKEETKPIYNWVLANPIKFDKPIQAKGKLGFWDFDIENKLNNK